MKPFSSKEPKVSVLMPVFNEERWIRSSVESVMMQRTDFDVELIVVDDASTDSTAEILVDLKEKFPALRVFRNETNSGKGFSTKRAFKEARGEYFHILDGDDIFTSRQKLQTQVQFLDENRDFFAVGHNTLLRGDTGVRIMNTRIEEEVWSNELCLSGRIYCHTSSLMFRKTIKELPYFFVEREFRGDTALFFFFAYTTRQKCKYLPCVWSLYNFHGQGLWSSMAGPEKKAMNIAIIKALKEKIVSHDDAATHAVLDNRISSIQAREPHAEQASLVSMDSMLAFARRASSSVFSHRDAAFKNMHAFRLVDEICEALGRATVMELEGDAALPVYHQNEAVILVSGLVPGGGGIFREITAFINVLLANGFRVGIVSTQSIPTDRAIFEQLIVDDRMWYWCAEPESDFETALRDAIAVLARRRPEVMFPFITHNDVVGDAVIQPGLAQKVIFDYVYDHGLSLGILNSAIDTVIVKTVSQARALQNMLPNMQYSLVPPFMDDHEEPLFQSYQPFCNSQLTTASAAARAYKVESDYRYSYVEIIPQVMSVTGGQHVHFGPLSDGAVEAIMCRLDDLGVPRTRFNHISWTNKLGRSLVEEGVGLFIAPFPVCSARIAMEVMSVGVPSINHHLENTGIPQAIEFTDPQQLVWRTPAELLASIGALTPEILRTKSVSARNFFEINNETGAVMERLIRLPLLARPSANKPEFVMTEFSERFRVEVQTKAFGGREVFSPPGVGA